jgi:hypothetical protein
MGVAHKAECQPEPRAGNEGCQSMTTNRMVLTPEQQRQSYTDEELDMLADSGNNPQSNLAREVIAHRKASKEPIGVTDMAGIECLKRGEMANIMPPDYKGVDVGDEVFIYAAPPLQAVTLPPEFHSEHGVVVQLEKVMAALAVHEIKYERRHQKVVGLRAGIDAVRAEGIDVDAEKINAEKCHK